MYNVLLYSSYDDYSDPQASFTRVTFDNLEEAFEWSKKAIEQGNVAVFVPLKDEN